MDSAKDLIVIEEEASPFDHFIRSCDRCGGRFPSSYEKVVLSLSATKKKKKKKREREMEREREREREREMDVSGKHGIWNPLCVLLLLSFESRCLNG